MKRKDFVKVAEETLDSLPEEFRIGIQNVAILVEDFPPNQRPPKLGQRRRLLLGIFHGVPAPCSQSVPRGIGIPVNHVSLLLARSQFSLGHGCWGIACGNGDTPLEVVKAGRRKDKCQVEGFTGDIFQSDPSICRNEDQPSSVQVSFLFATHDVRRARMDQQEFIFCLVFVSRDRCALCYRLRPNRKVL